jgi:hypothetical protein
MNPYFDRITTLSNPGVRSTKYRLKNTTGNIMMHPSTLNPMNSGANTSATFQFEPVVITSIPR